MTLDWGSTHARIAVDDQGPGISNAGHARIFEVLHREASIAHVPGLGLFIAKQIVERHGGTISVDSEPGRGATFRAPGSPGHGVAVRRPRLTFQ